MGRRSSSLIYALWIDDCRLWIEKHGSCGGAKRREALRGLFIYIQDICNGRNSTRHIATACQRLTNGRSALAMSNGGGIHKNGMTPKTPLGPPWEGEM